MSKLLFGFYFLQNLSIYLSKEIVLLSLFSSSSMKSEALREASWTAEQEVFQALCAL